MRGFRGFRGFRWFRGFRGFRGLGVYGLRRVEGLGVQGCVSFPHAPTGAAAATPMAGSHWSEAAVGFRV